jgi:glycosyltransferase involved in cell wall biosynthesis
MLPRRMICILHGYLLDGSGSNLWTRSVARALCREGRSVHLVCQEPHPGRYDFITEAYAYHDDGSVETLLAREPAYTGRCIMHKPVLGPVLPVYVWDEYEEFDEVVPMVELSSAQLEAYLHRNVVVVERVVREHGIRALHANHAVLMSVVAQRVAAWTGAAYAIMPHGSALEYAVRPDARLRRVAAEAFLHAQRVLAIGDEIAGRVRATLGAATPGLDDKLMQLDLGVDTSAFQPIERGARAANIERVAALLRDVPRGRTSAQQRALVAGLANGGEDAGLAAALDAAGGYVAKQPDADVEAKLAAVDWSRDAVLAFVGRLIAAKGVHAVITALPFVLEALPALRLLVIGHGPLREPLEAMVHALAAGDRQLFERVVAHAKRIGTGEPEHLAAIDAFFDRLRRERRLEEYWAAATRSVRPDRVIFTGYLTHREMAWLLPCCDAAIFPSMVVEAGPLVFLEALASGVFPIGTYFGGMATKIDVIAPRLEPEHADALRVRPGEEHIIADIVVAVPRAAGLSDRYRALLRTTAEEHYDWRPVARRLAGLLDGMADGAAKR